LLPGSPAINAGVVDPDCATDQRSVARPQGMTSDIGAYEVGAAATPTPTNTPAPTMTPTRSPTVTASPTPANTPTPAPIPAASIAGTISLLVIMSLLVVTLHRRSQ